MYNSNEIKGWNNSKLALNESCDCVVKAIASAFNITYNKSHKFCKNKLGRENNKGVMTFVYLDFLKKSKAFNKTIKQIKYKPVKVERKKVFSTNNQYKTTYITTETLNLYTKRGTKYSRMTVGSFIKKYPKGVFILNVKKHTFTIKNSKIIGNYNDYLKKKTWVENAWQII